jgi:hypothetical protein
MGCSTLAENNGSYLHCHRFRQILFFEPSARHQRTVNGDWYGRPNATPATTVPLGRK